jgi:predicted  nucleic acid-binding Zn-ribbon protein
MTETARREAQQWKEQSDRMEETLSRQEEAFLQQIADWREQYRRVEKERIRLSSKLEEMVRLSPYPAHL